MSRGPHEGCLLQAVPVVHRGRSFSCRRCARPRHGAVLVYLLGWRWEFLPSFVAKLVPGVDLVPLWTMAVADVYRKSKRIAATMEVGRRRHRRSYWPKFSALDTTGWFCSLGVRRCHRGAVSVALQAFADGHNHYFILLPLLHLQPASVPTARAGLPH